MSIELYSKGLYDVIDRDEFVTLVKELKQQNDKIGLLKVLRHQFDLSLHCAKNQTDDIFDNKDIEKIYDQLSVGVLRKPNNVEFLAVCENLRCKGVMGTLQRLISKYCNVDGATFSNLQYLNFSVLQLKDELNYPFRYDD